MKRKLFLATIALGISGAFLVATTTRADDQSKSSTSDQSSQGAPGKGTSSISGQSHNFMRTSQLNSQSIKSTSGDTLGTIDDLVVDPAMGRIVFAVIAPSGGTEPNKVTAVPWRLFRPSGEGNTLTANIDKEKLSSAQTFDKSQYPDLNQPDFAKQVYSHYGLQWQDRFGAGGRVPFGGSESGTGISPSKGTDIDNSTAPDGKGTLRNDSQTRPGTVPDSTIPEKKSSDLK